MKMPFRLRILALAAALSLAVVSSGPALAEKPGGILRMPDFASRRACRSTPAGRRKRAG